MKVECRVRLAVSDIEVKLENGDGVILDPMPGLRVAGICLDPEVPEAVRGLATVVVRFNKLMAEMSPAQLPEYGKYIMIENWWRGVVQAAIEDGTLR